MHLATFIWDIDPEIINLFGNFSLRYYSLLFVGGIVVGFFIVKRMHEKEGLPTETLDALSTYIIIATVLGARLGHCLFYEPEYYLQHPLEMLLPFNFDGGKFNFTGYTGLASHGGIFAVFVAIYLYSRKTKSDLFSLLDKISVAGALAGAFIRLGNFFNSEILGKATDGAFGVVFKRVDSIPRHPAQLYEAIAYFLIFLTLLMLYNKTDLRHKKGFIFGLFFALLFLSRFVIEFFKINQVSFEDGWVFNMGQLLSIPFMLVGILIMILRSRKSANLSK